MSMFNTFDTFSPKYSENEMQAINATLLTYKKKYADLHTMFIAALKDGGGKTMVRNETIRNVTMYDDLIKHDDHFHDRIILEVQTNVPNK